ncbi:MAG: DUF4395 domain-containing protein [Quadrisphaera sp.]
MHDAQGLDPRSPRFGAAITSVLLAVTLVLALTDGTQAAGVVLLAALAGLFAWGGFAGIRRHPYAALFRRFVRPRLEPPGELEDPAPPTFAQRVGLVITAAGVLLALVGVPFAAARRRGGGAGGGAAQRGLRHLPRVPALRQAPARGAGALAPPDRLRTVPHARSRITHVWRASPRIGPGGPSDTS